MNRSPKIAHGPGCAYRVVEQSCDALKLPNRQTRRRNKRALKKLRRHIEKFGIVLPIVVDEHGNVLDGCSRLLIARELGQENIETVVAEGLTRAELKQLSLALNRLAEDADWDREALAESFSSIIELDPLCDLELTGFDTPEIDLIVLECDPEDQTDAIDQDLPTPPARPVSRLGDIFRLGRHGVMCGSILEPGCKDFLARDLAQVAITDAPYNRPPRAIGGSGRIQHDAFPMASGEMTEEEFTQFLEDSFRAHTEALQPGAIFYGFSDWRMAFSLQTAARNLDLEQLNLCIWNKMSGGMGSLYRSQHELCFVYRYGDAQHLNNVMLGKHGRNRTNVWDHPGANTFDRERRADLERHPTTKPVVLVENIILDCTRRGDTVLDGFLGSGTTLLAAESTGRNCRGVELHPPYVDVIIERWQQMTGDEAVNEATELTFSETRARRHRVRPPLMAA